MALELADIFRQYGPAYRQKCANKLLPSHRQAMRAIERCRTEALGGQVYHCPSCGETRYSYHSCRNRHCPKCQTENAQRWLEQQQMLLLPVPYFLLTFTLPAGFNEVVRSHQRLLYDLLFKTSAAATQQLAQEPRWIGGQIGMVGVLHTWDATWLTILTCIISSLAEAGVQMDRLGDLHETISSCRCERSPEFFVASSSRRCATRIVLQGFPRSFGNRIGSYTVKKWAQV